MTLISTDNLCGQELPRTDASRLRQPGFWLAIVAGPILASALVAGATASGVNDWSAVPAQGGGGSDSSEWRTLAISSAAEGSRTGGQLAPGRSVERLQYRPQRPMRETRRQSPSAGAIVHGPLRFAGVVGENLNATLRAAGVPASASDDYIRALATRIDISSGIGIADRFDLVIDHHRSRSGEAVYGKLLYAGLDRMGASDVQLLRWTVDRRADWVDAGGAGTRVSGMVWPVPAQVTSRFGMRMHPLLGFARFHRGIDLKARWGTPIVAAADGRVMSAGWSGGHGRQVRIGHADGLATSYAHMSRITAASGQSVRQGQVIGFVGSSGLSTGPHLHYEVFKNGRPVNPAGVRVASVSRVDSREREAMRARLRQLLSLKQGGQGRLS